MTKKFAIVLALFVISIVCCAGCIGPGDNEDPEIPDVPDVPDVPDTPVDPVDPVVPVEEYSVMFMLNYGDAGAYTAETVKAGETVSKPANPTRSGYTFKGWFTAAEGGAEYDFTQAVNADVTLYAQWKKKSSSSSGGSSAPSHTHSYTTLVETIDPTCTEGGHTVYKCSCGDTENRDYIEATGHSNAFKTEDGKNIIYCSICTVVLESENVPSYEAQIGNDFYTAFDEALSNANEGDVVILLAESITGTVEKDVIIDVNGKSATLTYSDGNYVKILGEATVMLSNGMSVTLEDDGEYKVAKSASGSNELYVYTINGLKEFGDEVNSGTSYSGITVSLMNDVDLNNEPWIPIGQYKTHKETVSGKEVTVVDLDSRFKGTFDGNDKTIKNLKIVQEDSDNSTGFFGTLNGVVKNLNIDSVDISGLSDGSGTVAGSIFNFGTIENCKVTNAKISSNHYVGGIVGTIYGSVKNCVVDTVELTATPNEISSSSYDNGDKIGGIVGFMQNDNADANVISGNEAKNVIISAYRDAGGVVGAAPANGHVIKNSVNTVTIAIDQATFFYEQKDANAAGIVGRALSGTVYNSNSESDVTITYLGNFVKVEETGKTYSSLSDALTAISAETYGEYTLTVSGTANWATGAAHDSTPLIAEDVDVSAVSKVTIVGADDEAKFVATGSGVGPIRAANGATLVFKDIEIVDESISYNEGAWELGYLEFGGNLKFENCNIVNAITIDGDSAEFVDCTFNSNKDSEYAVWLSSGSASFTKCEFNGARGIKIHECYGSDVTSVSVTNSKFTLSKKPGIAIGNVHTAAGVCTDSGHLSSNYCSSETPYDGVFSLSVINSDFNDCQPGDQGLYIYETDTEVSTITVTSTGNTITVDGANVVISSDGKKTWTTSETTSLEGIDTMTDAAGSGDTIVLSADVSGSAGDTTANSGYGATGITVTRGATLDGNGNTLTVTDANGTWDCAVNPKSGTVKDLTINGAFRGIFMGSASGDVYIDNVVIDKVCYTFNSDGGDKNYGVYISDSTLNGWTSFSDVHKEVIFTNCKFGKGTGSYNYAFCRPYNACTFNNCVFEEGFKFDTSKTSDITFENCYYGETLITAENAESLKVTVDGDDVVFFYNGLNGITIK